MHAHTFTHARAHTHTRSFIINTRHPLALLYNDKSPLENHHAAAALTLMSKPDKDVLAALPQVCTLAVCAMCILYTLMTEGSAAIFLRRGIQWQPHNVHPLKLRQLTNQLPN